MHSWITITKNNISQFTLLVLFIFLWQTLQISSSTIFNDEDAKNRQIDVIRKVSPSIIKAGDEVILSTHNVYIRKDINQLGASLYEFDSIDPIGFENKLIQILDKYCKNNQEKDNPAYYFIWTKDNNSTTMELSKATRSLNFFFVFQALLPYQGSEAFAIDKILRLQPKENMIRRYCEANKFSGINQGLLIIDANEFSPWIGSVEIGKFTWLANDPTRKMTNSDYSVIDMPPLVTYDVFWLGVLYTPNYWTFENQDTEAYEQVVNQIKGQNGIVLMDRKAALGITSTRFVKECDREKVLLESQLFRQMCLK